MVPGVMLAAPAVAAYLQITGLAAGAPYRSEWWQGAGIAPLIALILVWLVSPRLGRLRGQPRDPTADLLGRPPARRGRWSVVGGWLLRAGLLLAATNLTATVALIRTDAARGPHVINDVLTTFGGPALAAVAVLVAIRLWDRRPRIIPVTAETVRVAAKRGDHTLRVVRAENERVRRQATRVEAKLAAAHSYVDFVALCDLHRESVGCADGVYVSYRSAQASLDTLGWVVRGARVASGRWLTRTDRAQVRAEAAEFRAAAANLAGIRDQLAAEVHSGHDMVVSLNANTAVLKYRIRDDCGERGRSWYAALQERIDLAQAARAQ